MSVEAPTFEEIRDNFFLNPKSPNSVALQEGVNTIIQSWVDGNVPPVTGSIQPVTLQSVAERIARDYANEGTEGFETGSVGFSGAKRFDHLSIAQLHPADNQIGILGQLASVLANNNTIIKEVSPLESDYEKEAVQWLIKYVAGYDAKRASGVLVSGGTSANLTALYVAREIFDDSNRGSTENTWGQKGGVKLFTSAMAHYSVDKARQVLAPSGMIDLVDVPMIPGKYVLDTDKLETMVKEARRKGEPIMAIVAIAGETETGLVDNLSDIAEIAQRYEVYLHFDGAYGAPFAVSRQSHLFSALSRSNSVACDPHKYLYTPYSVGSVLFANSEEHAFLRRLNVGGEAYIYKDDQDARRQALAAAGQEFVDNNDNLGYRRIEGSMGGQGASALYNTIKYIGKHGIKLLLDHTLDLTTTFVDEIRAQDGGLKLSFDPHLNQVCVEPTVEDPENARWVEETSARLQTDFGIYLSTTSLPVDGLLDSSGKPVKKKVFRFIATHPHTTDDDIRDIADKLNETWEAVVHGK